MMMSEAYDTETYMEEGKSESSASIYLSLSLCSCAGFTCVNFIPKSNIHTLSLKTRVQYCFLLSKQVSHNNVYVKLRCLNLLSRSHARRIILSPSNPSLEGSKKHLPYTQH
jgi:hypothetical protein